MYEAVAGEVWERFGTHLDGSRSALTCVVSSTSASSPVRTALLNSFNAYGYGTDSTCFVTLRLETNALDPDQLFFALEGIDPRCVVASDAAAAQALSRAYRQEVPTQAFCRMFGRNVVAFRNLDELLRTPESKQVAWALLKRLPKFAGR